MDPVMPAYDRQSPQRPTSTSWWQRIHGAIRMLCLLLIGVVAVGVAANAAPVKRQTGPAPVVMDQIVAAGSSVFALAADRQAVYEWSEGQANWMKVKDATQKLYPGGDTVYAIEPGRGDISKYDPETGRWPVIGGPGTTFAATSKHLYGVSPDHNLVMEYSGKPGVWRKVGNRAQDLFAGPNKNLYVTNPDDKTIHRYDGGWNVVGGPGATFAVTDKNLFGLTPDHKAVVQHDPGTKKWNPVGGPAGTIFAGNTLYATNPDNGDLYKYRGLPGKWDRVSGPAKAFATSGHYLYRLAPDRRSVQKYDGNGSNDKWATLGAPAAGPAPSAQAKAARYAELSQDNAASRKAFKTAREEHLRGVPDPYEFRWSTNYCNLVRDVPFKKYDFREPCARHDFLSRNYRDMQGEKAFVNNTDGAMHINAVFGNDMLDICKNRYPGSQQLCQTTAIAYLKGVEGASAWNQLDPRNWLPGLIPPKV
ncbi:phospholipase A2 [Streptomyces sp. NPDC054956]